MELTTGLGGEVQGVGKAMLGMPTAVEGKFDGALGSLLEVLTSGVGVETAEIPTAEGWGSEVSCGFQVRS